MKRNSISRFCLSACSAFGIGFFCCGGTALPQALAQVDTTMAQVHGALGDNDIPKAVKLAENMTVQKPSDGNSWLVYASVLKRSGAMEKAIEAAKHGEEILANKGNLIALWCLEGDAHEALGQTEEAARAYLAALGIATDSHIASMMALANEKLALLDYSKEQYPAALREFQEALALEKNLLTRAMLQSAIAHIYSKQKSYTVALKSVDVRGVASSEHQVLAEMLITQGQILANAGRFSEADSILQKGTQESRLAKDGLREIYGLRAFGYLYIEQGNRETALLKFQKALDAARKLDDKNLKQEMEGRCSQLQGAEERTFGAIDMGAKGVKGVLMDYYREDGKPKLKEVTRIVINTDLISTMTPEHTFTAEQISKTAAAIVRIAKGLRDARVGVRVNSITVGGSSGLAVAENREALRSAINQAIQQMERGGAANVNCNLRPLLLTTDSFINSADELYYGILGSMPQDKIWNSTLLDIGSGDGRIGYITQDEKGLEKTNVEIPLGTLALTNAAKHSYPDDSYESALEKTTSTQANALQKSINSIPGFNNRKDMYLVGGAAWAMTTFLHPDKVNEGYVDIKPEDLSRFYDLMRQNRASEYTPDFSTISDEPSREKAISELKNVRKVFNPDNLMAAAILLKTVGESGAVTDQHLHFARFGNWALGLAQAEFVNHQTVE